MQRKARCSENPVHELKDSIAENKGGVKGNWMVKKKPSTDLFGIYSG